MYRLIIFFLYLFSINFSESQKLDYPIYYAEDICDEKITISSEPTNSSLIIKLLKNNSSQSISSCKVVIESIDDQKIHANIKHMIESYKAKDLQKSHNSITLTNRKDNTILIIDFNGLGDDIHIVITSYKAIDEDELCPKAYFLCETNKCIHQIFRCDTVFNCKSDENEIACALESTPGDTILLTIVLGILCSLLGTACLLTSYVYIAYYRKRERLLDSKQIMYGTVNASLPVSAQHSMKVYK